jgi:hypothetical protein
MSLSSARNYALRAAKSQDQKEAAELLSKAILELATSIEATDAQGQEDQQVVLKKRKSRGRDREIFDEEATLCAIARSEATKQSRLTIVGYGLLRFARNDGRTSSRPSAGLRA